MLTFELVMHNWYSFCLEEIQRLLRDLGESLVHLTI